MASGRDILTHFTFNRIELLAIASALLLAIASMFRGAVDDVSIAFLLLAYVPLMIIAVPELASTHPRLKAIVLVWLIVFSGILVLQLLPLAASNALWQAVHSITGVAPRASFSLDHAGWLHGAGRGLWLLAAAATALVIGAHESCARLFFQTLLIGSAICVSLTFFQATDEGVPTYAYYSYSHGFVNANNAAAYLGAMLLVGLAQASRFFRLPTDFTKRHFLLELLDTVKLSVIVKSGFILFAIVLMFAGLLMTGSRAGIALSILCSCLLLLILMLKLDLHSRTRRHAMLACAIGLGAVMVWCFTNFGHIITSKLTLNGINSNTRFEIYEAVLPMLRDHPLLGTGLGSFPATFPSYRPDTISPDGIIDKAHNSYLEFASEMGLPAFAVLVLTLGYCGWMLFTGVRARKERYITPALGLSLWVFAALFSLIDFPLQIPSLTALFLSTLIISASQTERRYSEPSTSTNAKANRVRIRKRRSAIKI